MSEQKIRAALIGAGLVAGAHIAALRAAGARVSLKTICARTPARAEALVAKHYAEGEPQPEICDDIAAVAADPEIDFAIIITPPNVREEVIRPLAATGKHILLEKPIARSLAEAEAVVTLCETAGVSLGLIFQHRMRAASLAATELAASGRLGALGVVEINVPWWRPQSYYDEPGRGDYARDGGGVMINQAIHSMDLALSLTGPVSTVLAMSERSRFHQMEAEDFVVAGLRFANGAIGSLVASTASYPGSAEAIALHYEQASLRLGAGALTVTWRSGAVETFGVEAGSGGGGADPMAFTHEWHQRVIEDFAEAIAQGRSPAIPGRGALAAHVLIDAATRSAREGREIAIEA